MRARSLLTALTTSTLLTLSAGSALAQAPQLENYDLEEPDEGPVRGSAGARLFIGGNLLTTPTNTPPGYEGLGFAGNAGGFGWGAGLYGEGRFFKHLGLELGLLHDQSTLLRNITYNGVVKIQERLDISTWRLNLLVKGILPFSGARMWLGVGPEFVLSSSVDAKNEIVEQAISGQEEKSTLLVLAAGTVIEIGDRFEIPIELRALRNLDVEDDWQKRVQRDLATLTYSVRAQSSWEFRIGLGFGVMF